MSIGLGIVITILFGSSFHNDLSVNFMKQSCILFGYKFLSGFLPLSYKLNQLLLKFPLSLAMKPQSFDGFFCVQIEQLQPILFFSFFALIKYFCSASQQRWYFQRSCFSFFYTFTTNSQKEYLTGRTYQQKSGRFIRQLRYSYLDTSSTMQAPFGIIFYVTTYYTFFYTEMTVIYAFIECDISKIQFKSQQNKYCYYICYNKYCLLLNTNLKDSLMPNLLIEQRQTKLSLYKPYRSTQKNDIRAYYNKSETSKHKQFAKTLNRLKQDTREIIPNDEISRIVKSKSRVLQLHRNQKENDIYDMKNRITHPNIFGPKRHLFADGGSQNTGPDKVRRRLQEYRMKTQCSKSSITSKQDKTYKLVLSVMPYWVKKYPKFRPTEF